MIFLHCKCPSAIPKPMFPAGEVRNVNAEKSDLRLNVAFMLFPVGLLLFLFMPTSAPICVSIPS